MTVSCIGVLNFSLFFSLIFIYLFFFFIIFYCFFFFFFFFSSRRRHTRFDCDWSSDVCSSDLDCSSRSGRLASRPPVYGRQSSSKGGPSSWTGTERGSLDSSPTRAEECRRRCTASKNSSLGGALWTESVQTHQRRCRDIRVGPLCAAVCGASPCDPLADCWAKCK